MEDNFCDLMRQFLTALETVFPECTETKKCTLKFQIGVVHASPKQARQTKKTMITSWHEHMSEHYDGCAKKDPAVIHSLSKQSFLKDIDLWSKWNDDRLDSGTQDCIWEYMQGLNRFCQMHVVYNSVPTNLETQIMGAAKELTTKMQESSGGAAEPEAAAAAASASLMSNPANLFQMGQRIASKMKPSELNAFASNMMSNIGTITALCNSIPGLGKGGPQA